MEILCKNAQPPSSELLVARQLQWTPPTTNGILRVSPGNPGWDRNDQMKVMLEAQRSELEAVWGGREGGMGY